MSEFQSAGGHEGGVAVLDREVSEPEFLELYFAFEMDLPAQVLGNLLVALDDIYVGLLSVDPEEVDIDPRQQLRITSVHSGESLLLTLGAVTGIGKLAAWLQKRWQVQEEIRRTQAERRLLEAQRSEALAAEQRQRSEIERINAERDRAQAEVRKIDLESEKLRVETELLRSQATIAQLEVADALQEARERQLKAARLEAERSDKLLSASPDAEEIRDKTNNVLESLRSAGVRKVRINQLDIDLAA